MKAMIKRRSAIEPTIGHMKSDGRLDRNPLKGALGDALHAVLCGAGHNIRLLLSLLRGFLLPIYGPSPWLGWGARPVIATVRLDWLLREAIVQGGLPISCPQIRKWSVYIPLDASGNQDRHSNTQAVIQKSKTRKTGKCKHQKIMTQIN
jgi:hypothetical protein